MKSIYLQSTTKPLESYLNCLSVEGIEDFALYIGRISVFGNRSPLWSKSDDELLNSVKEIMVSFIGRFKRLPASQYRLKRFAFYISNVELTISVIQELGSLYNAPDTAVYELPTRARLSKAIRACGNIRRFYYDDNRFNFELTQVNPEDISASNLISIGCINFSWSQPSSWAWIVKWRPLDTITIAEALKRGESVKLDPLFPKVAFALRENRDFLNRMRTVCTLIMLGKMQRKSPLYIVNKDCIKLILSYLSPKDWDFRGNPKRRNLTPKTAKWANDLIKRQKTIE